MVRRFLVLMALLVSFSIFPLSPHGVSGPQRVLLQYSFQGRLPNFTLAMSISPSTGKINSIILTRDDCEIVVPPKYYQDLDMPFLAEAGLFLDPEHDGSLAIEIRFGAFLPNKDGVPIIQIVILDVVDDAVVKRRFMMQENGSLWYEEW